MKKNLLLINPWIYDFAAFDLWSKPLGLLYLASFLRNAGYQVKLIDCLQKGPSQNKSKKYGVGHYPREVIETPELLRNISRNYARYGISEYKFIRQLKANTDVDAILITSVMTYWYPAVQRAVQLVREHFPGVPIILGGIYASLLPEHAKENIKPDYLITGPGEIQTLKLLGELWNQQLDGSIDKLSLDDYPYPAFDLVSNPEYLVIITERGCPYDCSFCAQKKISMPYTRRSPENVIREFEQQYQQFHLRDFAFYDDALFISKETHVQIILEGIIRQGLPLRLHSPNGLFARYVDKDLAELMFRANFKTVRLSFETSNETRREDMFSKVSNEDMVNAVRHLTAAGYRPKDIEAYIMMGLPGQDPEEVIASILFVHALGVRVSLASFSPIHGTREFEKAVQMNLIPADIDPLLTNNSIYPLSNPDFKYETFTKIRTFTQVLNEAAQRELKMFNDSLIGSYVTKIVSQL